MSTIINASTSSGLVQTADTSGTLELQSNGTTMQTISSTGSYGQLKQAVAKTYTDATSSGTILNFGSIPSWVKRITIVVSGLSTTGTANPLIQLGTAGGIDSSNYLGASGNMTSSVAVANYTTGFGIFGSAQWLAANLLYGSLVLTNLTGNTWVASGNWSLSNNNTVGITAGTCALGGTLTQLQFITTNAFDAGSINILYEG